MYKLLSTKIFNKDLKKLVKTGRLKQEKIEQVFQILCNNPFHPSLKTHQVNSKNHGQAWSSRVDMDIRIIWNFNKEDRIEIWLLDIGGHSGKNKVYN